MDIQLINNSLGAAHYCAAYVSKGESGQGSLSWALKDLARERPSGDTRFQQFVSVAMKLVGLREISAQEAAFILLGLEFVESSRAVVSACVLPKDQRCLPLNIAAVRGEDEAQTVAARDWVAKYCARPRDLESLTGYEYLESALQSGRKQAARLVRSRKKAIVHTYPAVSAVDNDQELFSYSMLLLHTRYRSEQALVPSGTTAVDMLAKCVSREPAIKAKVAETLKRREEKEAMREIELREQRDALEAEVHEEKLLEDQVALIPDLINESLEAAVLPESLHVIPHPGSIINIPSDEALARLKRAHTFVRDATRLVELRRQEKRLRLVEELKRDATKTVLGFECSVKLADRIDRLNEVQLKAFQRIIALVKQRTKPNWLEYLRSEQGRYQNVVIVTGKAGSGKSYLINCLNEFLKEQVARQNNMEETVQRGRGPVAIGAFTGIGAHNVGGTTLHELFSINVGGRVDASHKEISSLRTSFAGVQLIVADEYGMISDRLFASMHRRLTQLLPLQQQDDRIAFGGHVILFAGDFAQLLPVAGRALYEMGEPYASMWQGARTVFWLERSMRQHGDQNERFVELLDRCALSCATESDFELLKERTESRAGSRFASPWNEAVWLNLRNADVDADNRARLVVAGKSPENPIVNIFRTHARQKRKRCEELSASEHKNLLLYATQHNRERLPQLISLCKGCPVIITENISLPLGLVNGTSGFVFDILFPPGFKNHATVEEASLNGAFIDRPVILLKLDERFAVPGISFIENMVGIVPITARKGTFKVQGASYDVFQLPLRLAFSSTIHKIQGATLENVVINFDKVRQRAVAYTALSRVRSIDRLLIRDNGFTLSALNAGAGTRDHLALLQEQERLRGCHDNLTLWGDGSYMWDSEEEQTVLILGCEASDSLFVERTEAEVCSNSP
jgi:energy-coupling factor transporter ATP-binding protein EcfA2